MPIIEPSPSPLSREKSLAKPKSPRITRSNWSTKMFLYFMINKFFAYFIIRELNYLYYSGLISKWMIFLECKKSRASSISIDHCFIFWSHICELANLCSTIFFLKSPFLLYAHEHIYYFENRNEKMKKVLESNMW